MNTTEIERARLDLIVGDLDHKFTTGKVAESIADIRNVLQWESHRMGVVSAGVLRGAVERLESVTAND